MKKASFSPVTLAIAAFLFLVLSSCGGSSDLTKAVPADMEWRLADLEKFDKEKQEANLGKVVEVLGQVIRSNASAANEKHLGNYFIYVTAPKGPGEEFDPASSCYTWSKPSVKSGDIIKLKGILTKGPAIGGSLMNCYVEKMTFEEEK